MIIGKLSSPSVSNGTGQRLYLNVEELNKHFPVAVLIIIYYQYLLPYEQALYYLIILKMISQIETPAYYLQGKCDIGSLVREN